VKDDKIYLFHILDAVEKIERYIKEVNKNIFLNSDLIQDASIRQLIIIGEAVKNVSSDLRNLHQEIEWRRIAGMKDKLTHDYLGVDLEAVWITIIRDLPILKEKILEIVNDN